MNYWLMKSEPGDCSVDDALAAPNATVPWVGVRNYQARNFMKDAMQLVDVQMLRKTRNLTLPELRTHAKLADLVVLRKGNRLSITPVEARRWQTILGLRP
jgi:predicted RNA-binding protein with PUA-like domain